MITIIDVELRLKSRFVWFRFAMVSFGFVSQWFRFAKYTNPLGSTFLFAISGFRNFYRTKNSFLFFKCFVIRARQKKFPDLRQIIIFWKKYNEHKIARHFENHWFMMWRHTVSDWSIDQCLLPPSWLKPILYNLWELTVIIIKHQATMLDKIVEKIVKGMLYFKTRISNDQKYKFSSHLCPRNNVEL